MKIRWTQSSVRLRISPSELSALERGEAVEEALALGENAWRAKLQNGATTQLETAGVSLIFSLSVADRAQLSDDSTEGVYFSENGFCYFVEKDFPCAHPRAAEAAEPVTETFARPPGFEERKN